MVGRRRTFFTTNRLKQMETGFIYLFILLKKIRFASYTKKFFLKNLVWKNCVKHNLNGVPNARKEDLPLLLWKLYKSNLYVYHQ